MRAIDSKEYVSGTLTVPTFAKQRDFRMVTARVSAVDASALNTVNSSSLIIMI